MSVEVALKKFVNVVVDESKNALTKKDRNVSKSLYNSIKGKSKVSKNSFEISFEMEEHGKYLDKGVKGKSSSLKAPDSDFQFGSGRGKKGGLTEGILNWVTKRRFQFRERKEKGKKGQFLSYKSTAFLITRSIYLTGTKPTEFFTKPFNAAFKKLPDEIVKAYALEVNSLLKNSFQ
jgi:hypothetical protein